MHTFGDVIPRYWEKLQATSKGLNFYLPLWAGSNANGPKARIHDELLQVFPLISLYLQPFYPKFFHPFRAPSLFPHKVFFWHSVSLFKLW